MVVKTVAHVDFPSNTVFRPATIFLPIFMLPWSFKLHSLHIFKTYLSTMEGISLLLFIKVSFFVNLHLKSCLLNGYIKVPSTQHIYILI